MIESRGFLDEKSRNIQQRRKVPAKSFGRFLSILPAVNRDYRGPMYEPSPEEENNG